MSEDIRCNVIRSGVTNPIAANIPVQLDKMNALEAASYQGADPHFTYKAFTTMLPLNDPQLILFRDYMIDQITTDAITHQLRKYLIISDPEMHVIDGHWQWVAVRQRGT